MAPNLVSGALTDQSASQCNFRTSSPLTIQLYQFKHDIFLKHSKHHWFELMLCDVIATSEAMCPLSEGAAHQ